eukprot:6047488-Karenia_brevis.AAC.1
MDQILHGLEDMFTKYEGLSRCMQPVVQARYAGVKSWLSIVSKQAESPQLHDFISDSHVS